MKKIALILLVVTMLTLSVFSLSACNKEDEQIALTLDNYKNYVVINSTISDLSLVENETDSGVNTSYCTFVLTLHASKRSNCELKDVIISVKRAWRETEQFDIPLSNQGMVSMSYPCHDTISGSSYYPFSNLSNQQYRFEVVDIKGYVIVPID